MYRQILPAVALWASVGCAGEFAGNQPPIRDQEPAAAEAQPSEKATHAAADHKIIFTATIDLVVQNFRRTEEQLVELVSQAAGYVAEFREDRRYGEQLAGHWVIRIPQSEFDSFTAKILGLGAPQGRQIDAQDVTEQFVDLTSRLNNKRRLEERVLKLLDERTDELQEVIEVEVQLGRVREEIELLEGKLRYMSDRVAMSTVTISVREDKRYAPPQAPTFLRQVYDTFLSSLRALRRFGEAVALIIVAAAPWLVVGAIALSPPVLWRLRHRRRE